jgi:DivIVA domain-containing protein
MPLTPEDVQAKTFKETRFKPGYDEDEVDSFLDEIESELRRLISDNGELRARTRTTTPLAEPPSQQPLSSEPEEPETPVTTASASSEREEAETPVTTASASPSTAPEPAPTEAADDGQQAALRTLLLAQRTADEAVAEARAEAEQIRTEAREHAEQVRREVEEEHAGRVAELTRERGQLEATIEELRAFEREYRNRLKSYLQTQLRELAVRPVAAPAADAVADSSDVREAVGADADGAASVEQEPARPLHDAGDGHNPDQPLA